MRRRRRRRRPGAVGVALALVLLLALAGCAVPREPCDVAMDALAVDQVSWDDRQFRVEVRNRSPEPVSARIFVEIAIVQEGRVVVEGAAAPALLWGAEATQALTIPFAVNAGISAGPYEQVTHLKCLAE